MADRVSHFVKEWGTIVRLSGWIRLGLVASIVWMLLAGVGYEQWEYEQAQRSVWDAVYQECLNRPQSVERAARTVSCVDEAASEVAKSTSHHWGRSLTRALEILVLAWLGALIATFTMRWVRRGFRPKSP